MTLHPPMLGELEVTSAYGWRTLDGVRRFHRGTDYHAPLGTPIYALDDGEVLRVDVDGVGWGVDNGHAVNLRIPGYRVIYLHLDGVVVFAGQRVRRGDLLGYTGSSGDSRAPHLHLGIVTDPHGVSVDPEILLRARVPRTLRRGDEGEDVRRLQEALAATWDCSPGPIDGDFGPRTEAAVRRFQTRFNLEVDGLVGPATAAVLWL